MWFLIVITATNYNINKIIWKAWLGILFVIKIQLLKNKNVGCTDNLKPETYQLNKCGRYDGLSFLSAIECHTVECSTGIFQTSCRQPAKFTQQGRLGVSYIISIPIPHQLQIPIPTKNTNSKIPITFTDSNRRYTQHQKLTDLF